MAEYKFDLSGSASRLRAAMDDATPLLKQCGALMLATSQEAFREQRLGDREWPAKYPGMGEPFINIAGALSDWNSGRKNPKPSRFQARPANVDEGLRGGVWGSLAFDAQKDSARVGTNKNYASRLQRGGTSGQIVSTQAKQAIKEWLWTKRGQPKAGRAGYVRHLNHLLHKSVYTQKVIARPFLGFTDRLTDNLLKATQFYFRGVQRGGA